MKKFYNLLFIVISFSFSFVFFEFLYFIAIKTNLAKRVYTSDPVIGWKPIENKIQKDQPRKTFKGKSYSVDYSTNELGFRHGILSPNNSGEKKRIFVVGDSTTGSPYTSDDKAWFYHLEEQLPYEVFVYAAGGYSTIQEWLVFRKFVDKLNPDILLIQYCTNDVDNDFYNVAMKHIVKSQVLRKPYYIDNKFAKSNRFKHKVYRILFNKSYLFQRLDKVITSIKYKKYNSYFPEKLTKDEIEGSISNWKYIYSLFVKDAQSRGIEVWSFSCGSSLDKDKLVQRKSKEWENLSRELNVLTFPSPIDKVVKAASEGLDVFASDGYHLNELGNKILADELIKQLKEVNKSNKNTL